MTASPHADLAALQARLAAQEARLTAQAARIASLESRRRLLRRALPLALVVLLVLLTPLSLRAAAPFFSDLGDAAAVHRGNIQALGDAGITTGFENPADPSARLYSPKGLVTREEMASFLARSAGLGGNPPVANALTATSATNAGNAATVGGYAPNRLLRTARAVGTNTDPFSAGTDLFPITALQPAFQDLPGATLTIQAPGDGFVLVSGTVGVGKGGNAAGTVVFARLRDASPGAPASAVSPKAAAGSNSTNQEYSSLSPTFVFPVSGAGPKTFTLQVAKQGADAVAFNGVVSALFVPFAQDGGSSLAP